MEIQNTSLKTYTTSDIYTSAFLQEQGFRITGTRRANGRVCVIFDDPENSAQDAVRRYYNGARVCAVRFSDRLRHLKTLVMRGWT
jgi:hypothetical protein